MSPSDGASDGTSRVVGGGHAGCAARDRRDGAGAPRDVRDPSRGLRRRRAAENAFDARGRAVEFRGRELAVEAHRRQGTALHCRTAERLAPGDDGDAAAPPERVLLFDAERPAMARD